MNAEREKILETLLVLVIAFALLSWLFNIKYFLVVALVIGLTGLIIPRIGEIIHWFWLKFSHVIGRIMNSIFLMLIYIAVLLPLAFLSKVFGKLTIQLKPGGLSYFRERNVRYTKETLERMW